MRDYNKKIEEALALLSQNKIKDASELLAGLVEEVNDKKELVEYIEIILTENAKEKPETRESLKTFLSSITWRVAQGFGIR